MLRPIHIYIYLYTTTAGFVLFFFLFAFVFLPTNINLLSYDRGIYPCSDKNQVCSCRLSLCGDLGRDLERFRSCSFSGYVPDRHTWFCPHVTCFHVFKRLLRFTLSKSCSLAISIFLSDELLTNY